MGLKFVFPETIDWLNVFSAVHLLTHDWLGSLPFVSYSPGSAVMRAWFQLGHVACCGADEGYMVEAYEVFQ